MNVKSPFKVYQEFVSPLYCEDIVEEIRDSAFDVDPHGKPLPTSCKLETIDEQTLFNAVNDKLPDIEKHFEFEYKGCTVPTATWYPEECPDGKLACDNSEYLRQKWLRTRNVDFTCMLFLSDYNQQPPFESDYEVYGGKVEFPQHRFGFAPQRGTMIVFPAGPHFIHRINSIYVGELHLIKFNIAATTPYMYDPKKFPGTYTSWFVDIA